MTKANVSKSAGHYNPQGAVVNAYRYFDRVGLWLKEPLTKSALTALRQGCGPGGLHVANGPAWFDPRYRQRLQLYQPTTEALHLLDRLDDDGVLLNCIEVTIDLIFADDYAPWQLDERFKNGFLQPWHGKMQVQSYPEGYTTRKPPDEGERRTGHWYDWYGDRPCKLTGETACFHFEGRHEGVQFVRRIGLHYPRDLINFDFDAYFTRWFRLYDLDLERLGRYHQNKLSGGKRKRARIEHYGRLTYNRDRRIGGTLYHVLSLHANQDDRSLQRFIDQYGRGPFLTPHIIYEHINKPLTSPEPRIPAEHL